MPTVIERINAGLNNDTPSRIEWRSLLETALFEIERLNTWADGFSDAQLKERRLCEERIQEMSRESERLRAALKPFAEAARHYVPYSHSTMADRIVSIGFTLGQLRAAADAYGVEQSHDKSER